MPNIKVTLDLKGEMLTPKGARQVPFAMSLALNETAKLAQLRVQQSLNTRFTIAPSKQEFFRRLIKIPSGGFATKSKLYVDLDIFGPNNAPGRANLLRRHVFGGSPVEPDPNHPFFIPSKTLRPGAYDLPPRALYPKALRLMDQQGVAAILPAQARTTKRGRTIITSKRKNTVITERAGNAYFVVPLDNPLGRTPGIYVKKKGADKPELLWMYRKKIHIPARLPFKQDIQAVFDKQFATQFNRAFARAMATAK